MKRIMLTFVLLGLFNFCFGQKLNKPSKNSPSYLLDYYKENPFVNRLDVKELASDQSNTKALSDGMVINSTKHFVQIEQPDVTELGRMPQVSIDTTMHYHIQIIGKRKND